MNGLQWIPGLTALKVPFVTLRGPRIGTTAAGLDRGRTGTGGSKGQGDSEDVNPAQKARESARPKEGPPPSLGRGRGSSARELHAHVREQKLTWKH